MSDTSQIRNAGFVLDCKHDSNYRTVSTNFELHYYHALVGVVNQSGCGLWSMCVISHFSLGPVLIRVYSWTKIIIEVFAFQGVHILGFSH